MVLHWPKGRDTKLAQILQRQYLLPLATYKKYLHRIAEKLMTNIFINSLMRLTEQTRLNFTVKFLSFPTLSNNSSSEWQSDIVKKEGLKDNSLPVCKLSTELSHKSKY